MSPFRGAGGPGAAVNLGAGIRAFSLRGAGGGGAVLIVSLRLSSPDRLGGGGEGGLEPAGRGDLGPLIDGEGVCDRLGILNPRDEPPGVEGVAIVSGLRNGGWSPTARVDKRPFGGD